MLFLQIRRQDLSSDTRRDASCVPLLLRAVRSGSHWLLHAVLMSLRSSLDAFLQAAQGNVTQTPLINHSTGMNYWNGTASSSRKAVYFHGDCVRERVGKIYTNTQNHLPNRPIRIPFFSFSFFPFTERSSLPAPHRAAAGC